MPDVFTKAKRSDVMSRIRGRGNKGTELAMIRIFRSQRITGWRRHQRVFGKPDFVFPDIRLAVFVDGCFWHGCRRHFHLPHAHRQFWRKKIAQNRLRDGRVNRLLRHDGWKVLRFWEHDMQANEVRCLQRLRTAINR